MAYQNVGTPRFYINDVEWLDSIGSLNNIYGAMQSQSRTLPVEQSYYSSLEVIDMPYTIKNGFVAVLGHKHASEGAYIVMQGVAQQNYESELFTNVVNWGPSWNSVPEYDGFTIVTIDNVDDGFKYKHYAEGFIVTSATTGSVIMGSYYDMPHSPDLNLTMTREYGVKTIETKGGSTLSNANWRKPAMWGDAGAWELYKIPPPTDQPPPLNQALSRSGRRVWDLSFSYLSDRDTMPEISTLLNYEAVIVPELVDIQHPEGSYYLGATGGGVTVDPSTYAFLNAGGNSNFFSDVIHKTNGGQLPFIFNPAGGGTNPNNNPDMFAIAKLDMNSFKFEQVANSVYNMNLKIREVW